jgi:hypothetical protein
MAGEMPIDIDEGGVDTSFLTLNEAPLWLARMSPRPAPCLLSSSPYWLLPTTEQLPSNTRNMTFLDDLSMIHLSIIGTPGTPHPFFHTCTEGFWKITPWIPESVLLR